jgi:ATP-dependent Lon protease
VAVGVEDEVKTFLEKFIKTAGKTGLADKLTEGEQLRRQVSALFSLLSSIYGSDKLVLKAGKLEALNAMRSGVLEEQVLALQRLVYEDPTIDTLPKTADVPDILEEVEDEIADIIARRSVEDRLEKRIAERMQQRHEEYVRDIKAQILKEDSGPENPATLKKYAHLEKLERKRLARTVIETLRPSKLSEIVGQERACKALLSKIASPFPQHVILYGPPGIGKTTAARLVLEEAKKLRHTPFAADAPFVEVDGATLRWDPREVTNPLLGSVHDPIYQGAKRDLAEGGVPEPKLGLVTDAHGGVLFLDEIGELEPILLSKLLKVLEDKRVSFDSSYYDPSDPSVPKYVRKLFEEGAPADFVLIGATTRDPSDISPAIRSRCAEVYFEPLTPPEICQIVSDAAGRLAVSLDPAVPGIISEYTIEGRKAIGILADGFGLALFEMNGGMQARPEGEKPPAAAGARRSGKARWKGITISGEEIYEVIRIGRLSPYAGPKARTVPEIGRVFGLGVSGYLGSVVEIETVVFPAREKGKGLLRFNETAGTMAKDSVFNAASVIRRLSGEDVADYDIHVNIIGGGNIDGPSAGTAILVAILSALTRRPVHQDVAVSGEASIQGKVRSIGGAFEKVYGAKQAGMRMIVLPAENEKDLPSDIKGIQVSFAASIETVLSHALVGGWESERA